MLRHLSSVIALLGLIVSVSSGFAATDTKRVGNQEGDEFASVCPPGKAVAGIAANVDDRMRAVVALCRTIDPATGATMGAPQPAGKLVGAKGGGSAERICEPGQSIRTLNVKLTAGSSVHSTRATCYGPGTAPVLMVGTDVNGQPASPAGGTVDCGSGSYATAVLGTYRKTGRNAGILSIGLRCLKIGEAPAAANKDGAGGDNAGNKDDDTSGTDSADANAQSDDQGDDESEEFGIGLEDFQIEIGPDGVKIGGGGGAGGAKKGSKRFAEEPTTVYAKKAGKEIHYLEQGDTVTIIACEDGGEGWCQISKPVKGWVWGGDLN